MKSKFPSGTVTFLFTDIEDSTKKLWETAPEKMQVALSRHHTILREAIESSDGVVFQIIGDAFCAAFSTAQSAVIASLTAQRNLHQEEWDLPFPIRVRMGIHTGEAERDSKNPLTGGYASNQTLNRVARILSAGHGGQILLSMATRELVKSSLPANTQLRNMGEHRLKNLIHPEHLFQLTIVGPVTDFPPLKSLDSSPPDHSVLLTSSIGRDRGYPLQLLERAPQLQALDSALAQAKTGQGCVALVYGEAGIGKTSLVDSFARENKKSWRILSGACDSLFTPRPLGPLQDIALQTSGNLRALLETESDRGAIFSACLSELNNQSTILVIEDVHWADEATLDLLKYLGRRIKQTTSLMILTYRDDEIGTDHPLRILLGDLASSHALHIPVSPLSKDAVHELAKNKKIDAVQLHHLTNGNPFFITEVLAIESGIPGTVRDAVLARTARLSPTARRVLEATAVIGLRAEDWLLSEVANAEFASVEECVAKGMLQLQGEYYAFRHELAWQTVLESISTQRRIALHRHVLNALKESPETHNDFARLADHASGAKDAEAVLEYAPAAARQASALGAHRQAAAHYKTALQYVVGKFAPELRAELLDAYANECSLLNQRTEAKGAQEEALEIWQELGRREKEGRAYRRLSEIDHEYLFSPEREQYVAHAIELLETLPPSKELARAYGQMARVHMSLNKTSGADPIYWGSRALELAEQLGDVETFIHALNSIGAWEMAIGKHDEGQAKLERSLQLSLDHGFQFLVARSLTNLAGHKGC